MSRLLLFPALAAAGFFLGGCLRGDPLDWKVRAKDSRALASWRAKVDGAMSPDHRRRLDEALQEIRQGIAGNREIERWAGEPVAGGKDAIDDAVCRRIHERPLREVTQLGYELRVRRLMEELTGLENALKQNAQLVTRPGDIDSRHYLDGLHDRQNARVQKYRSDLVAAERELAPLAAASGRTLLPPPSSDQMGAISARGNQPPQRMR